MCVLLGNENVERIKKHQIPFEQLEVEKELGKGAYGQVCLGLWNGAPVALKFCKEKAGLNEFLKEANLTMYVNRFNSIPFHSIPFNLIQFNSIEFN
jgi:predicted Ser/Thr protein kinase